MGHGNGGTPSKLMGSREGLNDRRNGTSEVSIVTTTLGLETSQTKEAVKEITQKPEIVDNPSEEIISAEAE